ncbi:MAG: hypothetical protein IH595_10070 [Bacteroidales bacterium]|nr:hypothetical protein [Bacteroidales bacterium]
MMTILLELIKYIIPSVVLVFLVYLMMKEFTRYNQKHMDFLKEEQELTRIKIQHESKAESTKAILNAKLQAYERMTLFLERINPPNLIPRVLIHGQSGTSLLKTLQLTVREEFEHNLSQQIYISDHAWELTKAAKENILQLINKAGGKLGAATSAADLAQMILVSGFENESDPIEKALTYLKKDVREMFDK